ncbi:MAG: acyl-CoA dehydrogenase family protein [Acidimicrobiales bacterium]
MKAEFDRISDAEIRSTVTIWARATWDPTMTLGEWWRQLADAGWAVPSWPVEWLGKGWTRAQAVVAHAALAEAGVPGPPAGLGVMLAGPTLLRHGDDAQKQRFLPGIADGSENWCQLFSEPGAGSDLAGVQTRAVRQDARWVVTGQKVWTSNGQLADRGMLLARTNESAPKHRNLTWFALDMAQSAVEVRPLREMTGRSLFTEVFLDGASATDDEIVGGLDGGWPVARTTLMNERMGLGGGGGAVGGVPGRRGGMLETQAVAALAAGGRSRQSSGTALAMRGRAFAELAELAQKTGRHRDRVVRDRLSDLYIVERVAQMTGQRARAQRGSVADGGAESSGSIGKLLGSRATARARDLGLAMLGPLGMLWAQDRSLAGALVELCLFSPAVSIYGGTDQIQRNILAERVLGLPRE